MKKRKLDTINSLFSKLHLKVAHSRQINESTALQIDEEISEYMKAYTKHFPQKALPKHHILEKHVGPWIRNGASASHFRAKVAWSYVTRPWPWPSGAHAQDGAWRQTAT